MRVRASHIRTPNTHLMNEFFNDIVKWLELEHTGYLGQICSAIAHKYITSQLKHWTRATMLFTLAASVDQQEKHTQKPESSPFVMR